MNIRRPRKSWELPDSAVTPPDAPPQLPQGPPGRALLVRCCPKPPQRVKLRFCSEPRVDCRTRSSYQAPEAGRLASQFS